MGENVKYLILEQISKSPPLKSENIGKILEISVFNIFSH